jgi:hypothetical protein
MGASRLAAGAVIAALVTAGCGGGKEPPPFKEVKPSTTSQSTPAPVTQPDSTETLAGLTPREQRALAPLVQAQTGLTQMGDAVATAGTDVDKVVQRIASGYTAPTGASTPEVRRLANALTGFETALVRMANDPNLLPQLSQQLEQRSVEFAKKRPSSAASLANAKQQLDSLIAALPGLQRGLEAAASKARAQASAVSLDAQTLDDAVKNGSTSATSALNGLNDAIEGGVRALVAASRRT